MEESHNILGDARLWVGIGFLIFLSLSAWKLLPYLFKTLDNYSGKIASEIEEAKALKLEAENLLKEAKKKSKSAEKDAHEIIERAKFEAKLIGDEAQQEIEREITRKMKLADEKIERAKNLAVENIRKKAIENAINAAAETLKAEFAASKNSEKLVEKSLRLISGDIS